MGVISRRDFVAGGGLTLPVTASSGATHGGGASPARHRRAAPTETAIDHGRKGTTLEVIG